MEAAEARIPGVLRHRERAVTADDYRVLALQTPGVDVARVEVLPRFVPRTRAFGVPGVVTVMALPGIVGGGVGNAPNPRADQPLIEAVHAQLDGRRPLATELYVIGCEYVPLAVSLAMGLRDDAPRDATLAAVRARDAPAAVAAGAGRLRRPGLGPGPQRWPTASWKSKRRAWPASPPWPA